MDELGANLQSLYRPSTKKRKVIVIYVYVTDITHKASESAHDQTKLKTR